MCLRMYTGIYSPSLESNVVSGVVRQEELKRGFTPLNIPKLFIEYETEILLYHIKNAFQIVRYYSLLLW